MDEQTEQDWVAKAGQGEPAAVAELYRRYWRAARAAAYGVTGNLALAEDAASEAFYAALGGLHGLHDPSRFGPWLRTIVVRTARRLGRERHAAGRMEAQAPSEQQTDAPTARQERQELAALVHEAVAGLPPAMREAITLFYFEGYNVEEAARFVGVPVGTLKRRLHDARRRLQTAMEQIVKGSRPMNQQREQILRQLQELVEKGADSQQLFEVMRQALSLRPVPHDLLRTLLQRHIETAQKAIPPEVRAQRERLVREHWDEYMRPSKNALDPQNPVGAAACAIRATLSEFEERPYVHPDFDAMMRRMKGQEKPIPLPPGFAEGRPVSYWHFGRGLLIQDDDGSVYTQYELLPNKTSREDFERTWKRGFRISDTLVLSWLRPKPLELRDVESVLRRVSDAVIPKIPVSFASYDEPRYRSGLRMRIGDLRIPGATGGVLEPWPGIPDDAGVAGVQLYLESWASARSGQAIALAQPPFSLSEQ